MPVLPWSVQAFRVRFAYFEYKILGLQHKYNILIYVGMYLPLTIILSKIPSAFSKYNRSAVEIEGKKKQSLKIPKKALLIRYLQEND